jgi:hypothetical protein
MTRRPSGVTHRLRAKLLAELVAMSGVLPACSSSTRAPLVRSYTPMAPAGPCSSAREPSGVTAANGP